MPMDNPVYAALIQSLKTYQPAGQLRQEGQRTPAEVSRYRKAHGFDLHSGWPPSVEQQALAREHLAYPERQYDQTKNPIWVWRAYATARGAGLPIPDWVCAYFDLAFMNLNWLLQKPGEGRVIHGDHEWRYPITPPRKREIAPAIVAAFGFVPGGVEATDRKNHPRCEKDVSARQRKVGRWTPLDVDRDTNDILVANTVYWSILAGTKLLHAYEDAAAKHAVSRRTVERAWAKHKSLFQVVAKK